PSTGDFLLGEREGLGGRGRAKWQPSEDQGLAHQRLQRPVRHIVTTGEGVNALALSADGSLVAGAGSDGRVEVWRVSDGQTQWSRTLSSAAKSIQFSPDSKRLVVRAENGSERQFEAGNGRPVTDRGL